MKVVHVTHEDHGGAGVAAWRLHRGLLALGVESRMLVAASRRAGEPGSGVAVVAPADGEFPGGPPHGADGVLRNPGFDAELASWRGLVARYPNRTRGLETFSSPVGGLPGLEAAVNALGVDVVHLHWVAGMLDLEAPPRWLWGVPVVWTLHDMNPFTGGCHFSFGCEKFTDSCGGCFQLGSSRADDPSARALALRRAAYAGLELTCVGPSAWLSREAARSAALGGARHEVVPYGLDLGVFCRVADARARAGLEQGDFVILFGAASGLGRKGFDLLDRALAGLFPEGPPQGVRLAAFGATGAGLGGSVGAAVVDLGTACTEAEMAAMLSLADVFVLPTRADNLPNSVIESLACGTPVVSFAVGGLPEMVEQGITGWLARPEDPADLARGLAWAMDGKRDGAGRAAACRAAAEARYGLSDQARRMKALYQDILHRRAKRQHKPGGQAACSRI
ncbi:MAG: glycosyltransferase [Desulfovibrionaceae bacterium]